MSHLQYSEARQMMLSILQTMTFALMPLNVWDRSHSTTYYEYPRLLNWFFPCSLSLDV